MYLPQFLEVGVATDVVVEVVPVVVVRGDGELGGDCLEGPALRHTAESVGAEPGTALQWRPVYICTSVFSINFFRGGQIGSLKYRG